MKQQQSEKTKWSQLLLYTGRQGLLILKKLLVAFLTLSLTTILIFFVLRLTPGDIVHDYAMQLATQRNISYEEGYRLAVMLLNYDPNESLFLQFFRFVGGLFRGELGQSLYSESITANVLIKQRLPWTLFISSVALLISFVLGTAMGTFIARKRSGVRESIATSYIVVSNAIPDYLMGLLMVMLFAYHWQVFPAQGNYDISNTPGFNLSFILDVLYHAALPIMSYVFVQTGGWAMSTRGSAVGVLGEDYINAARARGLPESLISRKYLKRNAMLPLVTSLALSFAGLFGGSVLMESIFNYPGIGMELSSRIAMKDYFVVQGILLFTATIVIIVNLITDSIYSLIDPRVRKGD